MSKGFICPKCGYIGAPKRKKRGSTRMELISWFVLFPLGIPYSLWRMFSKIPVCRSCDNEMLINVNSVVGQRLLAAAAPTPVPPIAAEARETTSLSISEYPLKERDKSIPRPEYDPEQF